MDRYSLAREFEQTLMHDRIKRINDVQALQMVCIELVDANFRMRDLKSEWARMGWGPEA